MMTEVFGFLIIMGTVLFLIIRRQFRREPSTEEDPRQEAEEMAEAVRALRKELETAADEIISRMGTHMDRLEDLLQKADHRSEVLEGQLAELAAAENSVQADLKAGQDFSHTLQETLAEDPSIETPVETGLGQHFDQSMAPEENLLGTPATESSEIPVDKKALDEVSPGLMKQTVAGKARELLAAGYSVAEVSRETRLGKGAVELLQQMNRGKQEEN